MINSNPPADIILHKKSKILELVYANGQVYRFSAEFLRVHSPSAETKGHGKPVLQTGKQDVALLSVEPVGHYGVKLVFNDRHETGIYTWHYFLELGTQHDQLWQAYLQELNRQGAPRDPNTSQVKWVNPITAPNT